MKAVELAAQSAKATANRVKIIVAIEEIGNCGNAYGERDRELRQNTTMIDVMGRRRRQQSWHPCSCLHVVLLEKVLALLGEPKQTCQYREMLGIKDTYMLRI